MAERLIALPTSSPAITPAPVTRRPLRPPIPLASPRAEVAPPRLALVGVGGAGTNTLNRIGRFADDAVRLIALNTDAQALAGAEADERLCLGEQLTHGLGAGGVAEVGERAAEASRHHIADLLRHHDLLFVVAGLGGGTGTGAAPVVARIGREMGALVVGLAALPFAFEGAPRHRTARAGLARLAQAVDALIVFPNDRLLSVAGPHQPLTTAFAAADATLRCALEGIVALVSAPSLINVDFADVRAVLLEAGPSLLAQSTATGPERAAQAVDDALRGGWLGADIHGARRVLLHLTGGTDMTLRDVTAVAARVTQVCDPRAACVFGAAVDPALTGSLRVLLIAGGLSPQWASQA
jgi:cell division protein FtsZ